MSNLKTLDDTDFNSTIKNESVIMVEFGSEDCAPCRTLAPILEKMSQDHSIYVVDIDDSPETSKQLKIKGLPTLIVFKGGVEYKRQVGLVNKEKLLALFE